MKRLKIVLTLFITIIPLFSLSHAVEMKAGVAKAVITNNKPRVMVNGRVSDGKLHDIYARALVLNDNSKRLVFITYDLNCLDVATPILRTRVREELNIDPAYLILLATHNHNAPIQIVPDNFDYGKWLANRLFELIQEAIANEKAPARLFYGNGYGYFLVSTGNAPVDYEIQVLRVMVDGHLTAFLFNHPTHPLQSAYDPIDVGHPGYAMDELEKRYPGAIALYGDACGGNQFPEGVKDDVKLYNAGLERVKTIGHKLAAEVSNILEEPMEEVTGSFSSKLETLSLPLGSPIGREEALALAKKVSSDVGFVPYPHPNRDTNWVRMLLRYYDEGIPFPKKTTDMVCSDDTYLIHKQDAEFLQQYDNSINDKFPCIYEEVIVSQIGQMALVAMQGEVCAPIGARIKDAFRLQRPIMVFGYMGEHNLYIPTRELVRQNAYQAKTIQIQYASPVGWAPEVEDETVNKVIHLVKSMTKE